MLDKMKLYEYIYNVNGDNMALASSEISADIVSRAFHTISHLIPNSYLDFNFNLYLYLYLDILRTFFGGNYNSQSVDERALLC